MKNRKYNIVCDNVIITLYKQYTILCIALLSLATFLFNSCSTWKNRLVPHIQPTQYAYHGDMINQWALVRLDSAGGRWGYVSEDGKSAIQPVFEWADDFADHMGLVRYQNYYTYVNHQGKQMRRITAGHAYSFSEGLAAVQKGDKWGYIDHHGKWIIKPRFDWAMSFSQNRAAVAIGNHYGFINPQSEMVITVQYEDAKPFTNHLSIVRKNGKYGLIDTLGKEILPIRYHRIVPWEKGTYKLHVNNKHLGLADAHGRILLDTIYTSITAQRDNFLRVVQNSFAGLFDFNGREILSTEYTFLGPISDEGFLSAMKNGKFGILDTLGKTLLPFVYDDGQPSFAESRIVAYKDGKLLLMNTAFQIIKELPYDKSYPFSHGFAIVEKKSEADRYTTLFGFINRDGKEVIAPQYHSAYRFNQHGLTIAGIREQGITQPFIIDTTGTHRPTSIVIDHLSNRRPDFRPLYDLKPFGNRFFYNRSGSSFAFLSPETGLIISEFPYEALYPVLYSDRKDLAKVHIDSKIGLIDTVLNELLPIRFEDIGTYKENRISIKQSGKWGFADEQFRLRIPFAYDKTSSFRYQLVEVEDNKQKGIIDPKGRVVVPLQYRNITIDSLGNRIYAEITRGNDIYDMYGRLLLSSNFSYWGGYWGKNYSTFRHNGKTGIMDYDFNILCEPKYDRIGPFYEGRAWVIDNEKGGFLDSTFHIVIPIVYDYIEDYALGFTKVTKDEETYYIDTEGRKIFPSAEEITNREQVLEKRKKGFIDFSS